MIKKRCGWVNTDPLYLRYHDKEWGVPVYDDDRKQFEFLILEAAQAGLSWITVLRKRENYRKAFSGFDFQKVARYGKREIALMMKDAGLIRNRLKIESAVHNASRFLEIREEFGSFCRYAWQFVDGQPITHRWKSLSELPAKTPFSDAFSKDMKKRGFKFVGSTVLYAHMQALGMVNDHLTNCFRYQEVRRLCKPPRLVGVGR